MAETGRVKPAERQRIRRQEKGRPQPAGPALPLPLVTEDSPLAVPANGPRRQEHLRSLQQTVGNRALQRLLRASTGAAVSVQQGLPARTVARDGPESTTATAPQPTLTTPGQALTAAQTRAATPAGNWPQPTAAQHDEILGRIQARAWDAAVQAMWSAIRGSLPRAGQIDIETTADLGTVGGQSIATGAGGTALTLTCVRRRAECAGASPGAHRQLHAGEELRFLVQVSPTACTPPAEGVAKLHSTLVHEYVHVEQLAAQGVMADTNFLLVGSDREFFTQRGPGSATERQLAALDEIDAYCSEIENAGRTGLAEGYELHVPIDNLWGSYCAYFSAVSGQPDRAIATRVDRNIRNGRQMFRRYLVSPAAAWLGNTRQFVFSRTPPDYRADMLEPFVNR